ncbi:hypothetical protein D3C85_1687070 [compost metagenome]
MLVGIDLLINECPCLVAGLADVRQGFAWPGPAGVLFVLVAPPIAIEKADRHAVLTQGNSTCEIAIFPEDAAGIVGGQRLEFFDGNFGHEMDSPYFYPHKNVGS